MEWYSSIWHLLIAFIFALIGIFLIPFFCNYFKTSKLRGLVLYFWHLFFCVFYMFFVINSGGDSIAYFDEAQGGFVEFNFGTAAVTYLTYILADTLGVSLLGAFVFFNIFGFVGLLSFDASLRCATINASRYIKLIATLIVFLPSVSFWSSAIGKDSISFMAVGLALWASLNLNMRLGLMTFAVLAMLLVRPHMSGIMLIALAVTALLNNRVSLSKKVFMSVLSSFAALVMVPFALTYGGVVDVESVSSYIDTRQSYNMEGGGGVDISNMSLPEQLFTYMFRPLIFEINSVFSAAAAFDNLILLFLFVLGGGAILKSKRSDLGESRMFMWVYGLMAWSVLAMTTANLGIALRQKWMFAPMLIFLLISVIGRRKPLPSVPPQFGHPVHTSAVHASARQRQR